MGRSQPWRPRHLLVVLIAPLLLVLAGCVRMDTQFTVNSDETVDMTMYIEDLSGLISRQDMDCESMLQQFVGPSGAGSADISVEATGSDAHPGCLLTAEGLRMKDASGEEFGFTRDGDEVTFAFPGSGQMSGFDLGGQQLDPSQLPPGMAPEVRIAVTFPGPVTDADDEATIDGNTASWTTLAAVTEGGHATGELIPGLVAGTGWVIWVGAALLLVGVLVVVFVLFAQRKSRQRVAAAEGAAGATLAGQGATPWPGQSDARTHTDPPPGQDYWQGQAPPSGQGQTPPAGQEWPPPPGYGQGPPPHGR